MPIPEVVVELGNKSALGALDGQKVDISWKVEGVTGDATKLTGTKTGVDIEETGSVGSEKLVVKIPSAEFGTIAVEGNKAVKVTITSITFKTLDATTVGNVFDWTPSTIAGQANPTLSATTSITLKKNADGSYTNAAAITLTLDAGSSKTFTEDKNLVVLAGTGVVANATTANPAAQTVALEIAPETLTLVPGTALALQIVQTN